MTTDEPVTPDDPAVPLLRAGGGIRYAITHRTKYRYYALMTGGHSILHLIPRATGSQTVSASFVSTFPEADEVSTWLDGFDNLVTYVGVHRPHESLEVTAMSEVEVTPTAPPADPGPRWEDVPALVLAGGTADELAARAARLASPLVPYDAGVAAYAAPSFPTGRPVVEALADLTSRIHADFLFDPSFSDVSTPLCEVLAHRRGVCQDFAHLAIGCARAMGIPARYISGYIETHPPPGQPKLVGADASHAWCSAYVPGWGWLDLDPTNDQVCPQQHVTVAWGRDYRDVAPLRGVVVGPAAPQALDVAVDVIRLAG